MKSQRRRRAEKRKLVRMERLRLDFQNAFDAYRPDWARHVTKEERIFLTVAIDTWGLV